MPDDPRSPLPPSVIEEAVRRALAEDLGRAGDITSAATIPEGTNARAKLVARMPGVIAGLACAAESFRQLDPSISFRAKLQDGGRADAGAIVAEIEGPARAVLAGERVALNFVGHLSGIATLTAAFVAKVAHTKAKIVDTRKTLPGLRALEKYAVRCGGGHNHRTGLFDAMLIKDNHLALAAEQNLAPADAVRATRGFIAQMGAENLPPDMIIEIEVDRLEQLDEVLRAGPDIVLLDNMSPDDLRSAVARRDQVGPQVELEASGGVSLDTLRQIALTGVERISVGGLTHSARWLNLALDWSAAGGR
jgi:nicotinate-nucleotide pyrophosphorylase (carboxylating)